MVFFLFFIYISILFFMLMFLTFYLGLQNEEALLSVASGVVVNVVLGNPIVSEQVREGRGKGKGERGKGKGKGKGKGEGKAIYGK